LLRIVDTGGVSVDGAVVDVDVSAGVDVSFEGVVVDVDDVSVDDDDVSVGGVDAGCTALG